MVVVVAAGLVAVVAAGLVVVVAAGPDDREGAVVAGLDVVAGAFRSAAGVWASVTEAIANRLVIDKVIGLMWGAFW